jgi:hypothetical protein
MTEPSIATRDRRGPGRRWNAALLNLSGLSLGFFYLRRFKTGLGHLAGTALLVWIIAAGAVAEPRLGLCLALVWLGWTAFLAWRIGDAPAPPKPGSFEAVEQSLAGRISGDALDQDLLEPAAEPARRPWTATAVGAVLLAALVVGVLAMRGAANGEFEAATAAHEAGDCVAAEGHYDRIDARYQLSFSGVLPLAATDREHCEALTAARAAATGGEYELTVAAYDAYLALTDPVGKDTARIELSEIHRAQAAALAEDPAMTAVNLTAAIGIHALLASEFGDTDAGVAAPEAVQALYDGAIAATEAVGKCEPIRILEYFERSGWKAELGDDATAAELTAAAVQDAATRLPGLLFDCGDDAYAAGDRATAKALLGRFLTDLSSDPNAAAAKSILDTIAAQEEREAEAERQRQEEEAAEAAREAEEAEEQARIDQIRDEIADASGNGDNLSDPEPNGSSGSGEVTLEIGNATDGPLEVLYTGPETGSFTINGCSDCSTQCSDWVAVYESISLPAGEYEVVVKAVDVYAYPNYGVWDLDSGSKYTSCYYLTG